MGIYRHHTEDDVTVFLTLVDNAGNGVTGESPTVAIRRIREAKGGAALDGFYYDGAGGFGAGPTFLAMTEFDATNYPGLYTYLFDQSTVPNEHVYLVYFKNTGSPIGVDVEEHVFANESEAGTGSRTIAVTVEDQNTDPVPNCRIDVFKSGVFLFRVNTDVSGQVNLALDDGTYDLKLFALGYAFTVPETLTVTADDSVTISGTKSNIVSAPASPSGCMIYGTLRDAGGNIHDGVCIEVYAATPQVANVVQRTRRIVSVFTDANGYFEVELEQNTKVNVVVEEADIDAIKIVPATANQDLATWADA